MTPRALEEIIYFASYVVVDPADTPLERKQLLSEKEYRSYTVKNMVTKFQALMGAEAIEQLLMAIDLDKETEILERRVEDSTRSTSYTCDQTS